MPNLIKAFPYCKDLENLICLTINCNTLKGNLFKSFLNKKRKKYFILHSFI